MGKFRPFTSRIGAASAVLMAAGVGLVWLPSVAFGSYPQDSVTVYAGCLTPGGTVTNMVAGQSPTKPCAAGEVVVHLSGGTITQVAAGNGLTGGGTNGYVSLGLQGSYQLPQSCSDGQIIKWNAAGTGWNCANDQTYTNGTGLDLNGNTFSVNPAYQLPQNCAAGQFPSSKGPGSAYACGTVSSGIGGAYYTTDPGTDVETVTAPGKAVVGFNQSLPTGTYFVSATIHTSYASGQSDGNTLNCALLKNGDSVSPGTASFDDMPQVDFFHSMTFTAVVTVTTSDDLEVDCVNLSSGIFGGPVGTPTEALGDITALPLSNLTRL